MRRVDIHQHLWPDSLISSLARRTVPPRIRRDGRGWLLELAGDAPAPFDPRSHDARERATLATTDGLQRVLIAPSSPLGIESLAAGEAEALLAGLAPLHAERLAARGGPSEAVHDALTHFDTSSYGPKAIDAMLRVVGVDRLLYGSDRPVIEPVALAALGAAAEHAIVVTNPERFV